MIPATILAVDDDPKALGLLQQLLGSENYRLLAVADACRVLETARRERPDGILLDVMMPERDGFEICAELRRDPDLAAVPIILLTALDDRESRLRGLDVGADEFLTKPFNAVELRIRLRTIVRLNRYRRLHEESSRYEAAMLHSSEGIVLAELDGTIVRRNAAFDRLVALEHRTQSNLLAHFSAPASAQLAAFAQAGEVSSLRCTASFLRGGSPDRTVELTVSRVPWERRELLQCHLRDVTSEKLLEAQLLRLQRIELLGQVSEIMAHDMGNVLAAIGGSASLLETEPAGPSAARDFGNIRNAVQRGAGLLRQLMHFAQKGDNPFEPLLPAEIAGEVASLAQETFAKRHEVIFTAEPEVPLLDADPSQVRHLLVNLCLNSRDAFTKRGRLEIAVARRDVTPAEAAAHAGVRPGEHVVFTVRDDGPGIPVELRPRLFDPFLTTKADRTGLGLAAVLRLVRRHGGFVRVETETGRGTAVHCHFPINSAAGSHAPH